MDHCILELLAASRDDNQTNTARIVDWPVPAALTA